MATIKLEGVSFNATLIAKKTWSEFYSGAKKRYWLKNKYQLIYLKRAYGLCKEAVNKKGA